MLDYKSNKNSIKSIEPKRQAHYQFIEPFMTWSQIWGKTSQYCH